MFKTVLERRNAPRCISEHMREIDCKGLFSRVSDDGLVLSIKCSENTARHTCTTSRHSSIDYRIVARNLITQTGVKQRRGAIFVAAMHDLGVKRSPADQ